MNKRNKNSEFTHIKQVLKSFVREQSGNTHKELRYVTEIWETRIDRTVAENSKPDSLKNGILIVKVMSPAWSQQILFLKKNLMLSINSGSDSEIVKDIKCRITSHL